MMLIYLENLFFCVVAESRDSCMSLSIHRTKSIRCVWWSTGIGSIWLDFGSSNGLFDGAAMVTALLESSSIRGDEQKLKGKFKIVCNS